MDVVVQLVLGALIGAGFSIGISWYFFKKQAEDLELKVRRLEQVITVLAHYLRREGWIKEDLEFDEKGALKPFTQTTKGGGIPSGESLGGGKLTQEDNPAADTTDDQSLRGF